MNSSDPGFVTAKDYVVDDHVDHDHDNGSKGRPKHLQAALNFPTVIAVWYFSETFICKTCILKSGYWMLGSAR